MKEIIKKIQEIRTIIEKDNIKEAIEQVKLLSDELEDSDIRNQVIAIKSRYKRIRSQGIKGISSNLEEKENKLLDSLLDLLLEIEEEQIEQETSEEEDLDILADLGISNTKPKIKLNDFPKPKPYFAGRKEELKCLKEAYKNVPIILVDGSGGIGKTQLMAKFIEEMNLQKQLIWLDCKPTTHTDEIIAGAGYPDYLKGERKTDREKFSAFKDRLEEFELVLFIDNFQEVANTKNFKEFLAFMQEYLGKGRIILLCRDNLVSPNFQPRRIHLEGLGGDSFTHAQALYKNSYAAGEEVADETLQQVCNLLKGYPLAIDLAVYLLSVGTEVESIIKEVAEEAKNIENKNEKISQRLLNTIFKRPDATEQERDFIKLLSVFRGKIHEDAAKTVIPKTIFTRAKRQLLKRNLLQIEKKHLELHPLIREFCYEKLEEKTITHKKAADYFKNTRATELDIELEEKIFYHLSQAEEWNEVSQYLVDNGRDYILQGYLGQLQKMIISAKEAQAYQPIFYIFEGDIAEIQGDWPLATSFFEMAKEDDEISIQLEGVIKTGEMLYRKGDVKDAQLIFEAAIEQAKYEGLEKWEARARNDLGLVYEFLGDLRKALKILKAALLIRERLNYPNDIAISLNNVASVEIALGNISEAIRLSERSLTIFKGKRNKLGVATSLNYIGEFKRKLKKDKEALKSYSKSLVILKEVGDKSGIASVLNNIGLIRINLGQFKEALKHLKESLSLKTEIGDKSNFAISTSNIGLVYSNLGKNKEALHYYYKSLAIKQEIGAKSGIAIDLNNIGSTLLKEDSSLDKGCFYLLKSLAFYRQMQMPDEEYPRSWLLDMRKKLGQQKFKTLATEAYEKLEEDLQKEIELSTILAEPIVRTEEKVGRNEPCPCGSGKKYKKCHGKK